MSAASALVPRFSSTVLVLARTPASAFAPSLSSNLFRILFIQRARSSGFMAGAHVFPGGVLDAEDGSTEWKPPIVAPITDATPFPLRTDKADSLALRICALRELFEETGLMLARPAATAESAVAAQSASAASAPTAAATAAYFTPHSFSSPEAQRAAQQRSSGKHAAPSSSPSSANNGSSSSSNSSSGDPGPGGFHAVLRSAALQLDVGNLVPWSRWITPTFEKRRYDTLFYLAALPSAAQLQLQGDPREVVPGPDSIRWLSPVEALHLAEKKQIILPPPTTYILRELEQYHTMEQVIRQAGKREITPMLPRLLPQEAIPSPRSSEEQTSHEQSATVLHIALPGDPCYPDDDSGSLSSAALSAARLPLLEQQYRWHRILRSTDPKLTTTRIFRPAHLQFQLAEEKERSHVQSKL